MNLCPLPCIGDERIVESLEMVGEQDNRRWCKELRGKRRCILPVWTPRLPPTWPSQGTTADIQKEAGVHVCMTAALPTRKKRNASNVARRLLRYSRCIRQRSVEAPTLLDEAGGVHTAEHERKVDGSRSGAWVRRGRGQGIPCCVRTTSGSRAKAKLVCKR